MLKKVILGQTYFSEINQLFKFSNHSEFEDKKARLFPVGNADSETSTTSVFLASLSAVKEYREELLLSIGINKIKNKNIQLHTYTEIENKETNDRVDGLIVITSGKNNPIVEWMCFVEAKVGTNPIETEQIDRYSNFARSIGINSIITISNQLSTTPYDSPVKLKKNTFELYHWSWTYLKVMASRLVRTDSVEDEDHVYILKELRRYFDTHKYLSDFVSMGKTWKDDVKKVNMLEMHQKIDSETIDNISHSFIQEEKDISLQLTDRTECFVELVHKNDRTKDIQESLNNKKCITSEFIINNNKKKIFCIDVDFMKQSIKCYTTITVEKGKAQAQTSTLLRMLENEAGTTDNIYIRAYYIRNKHIDKPITLEELLIEKEEATQYSILNKDFGDTVKHFEIATIDNLGKNFSSTKVFIANLEGIADAFLTQVMENIKN